MWLFKILSCSITIIITTTIFLLHYCFKDLIIAYIEFTKRVKCNSPKFHALFWCMCENLLSAAKS